MMKNKLKAKSLLVLTLFLSLLLHSCQGELTHEQYKKQLYRKSNEWGLGKTVQKYVTNNRDYDWYVDQLNTGEFWYENCSPASIEMVGRYQREDFVYNAEDARALFHPDGGPWYQSNITNTLGQFAIEYSEVRINSRKVITAEIDVGNVLLVSATMDLMRPEQSAKHRVGLFYEPAKGHSLVIKGYVVVDDNYFFEFYDPWSIDERYQDGTLKGINRYHDEESALDAIRSFAPVAFSVPKAEVEE